jgi:methionyl-tRNA synthetase
MPSGDPKSCPDCLAEGRQSSLVHDHKQNGDVCPRCERVFSPLLPGGARHFASRKAAERDMRKYYARLGAVNRAIVDSIIKN